MERKNGWVIVAMFVLASLVPWALAEGPTRAVSAEITDIELDGFVAPNGEYSSGEHTVQVIIENTGNEYFAEDVVFYLNITYAGNSSVFYNGSTPPTFIPIDIGASYRANLSVLTFPEDELVIKVNATMGGAPTEVMDTFTFDGIVDLAVVNTFFTEGMHYELGTDMVPTCDVTYLGNIKNWAEDATAYVEIELLGAPPQTVFTSEVVFMTTGSSVVDPGHLFSVQFPDAWTPEDPGDYRARFSLEFDTYNETNNIDTVYFTLDRPPSIEGWVVTETVSPLVDVTVSLRGTVLIDEVQTDSEGYYSFYEVAPGTYTLEFQKLWLTSNTTTVTVVANTTTVKNATLVKLAVGGVQGRVFLPTLAPAVGAQVIISIQGETPIVRLANSSGFYKFESIRAGQVEVIASLAGYQDGVQTDYTVIEQVWNELDLTLGVIPFEVEITPPDTEPGFSIVDSVSLTFTRQVDKESVNDTTLYLMELMTSGVVPVIYSFTDGDTTVIMTPESPLEYDTEYMVTVTSSVLDINQNPFPGPVYSTFTTEVQLVEIELVDFYPGDDEDEVPIGAVIWAKFPEAMEAGTINASTFQVYTTGSQLVAGEVTYYSNNYTAVFEPDQALSYGARYSVALDPDIEAVDETSIFLGFTWSFQTETLVTTGSIIGFILDEDGEPFDPSDVTLTFVKGTDTITGNVNALGRFEVADLEEGVWTMTVDVDDYKEYSIDITVIAGEASTAGTVELEKEDEGGETPWLLIIIIFVIVLVVLILVIYFSMGQKGEEEEPRRGPSFGHREAGDYEGYGGGYAAGGFICPDCGNVVDGEESVCTSCGAEFEQDLFECPECGANISGDVTDCPECGAHFEEEDMEGEEGEEEEPEEEPDMSHDYEVQDIDEDELPINESAED